MISSEIINQFHLQRSYFQVRSHVVKVLGEHEFLGNTIQPATEAFRMMIYKKLKRKIIAESVTKSE